MLRRSLLLPAALAFAAAISPLAPASAAGLHGSHASMLRQNRIAKANDFTFLRTAAQVREFAEKDRLEKVTSTEDYLLAGVSFPYARPAIKLFIERLAAEYHAATGHRMVITSLTRPTSMQPDNASPLSVHPTGMAVDLRIPRTSAERNWLVQTLLSLENKGLLDVTQEHYPPHLHVAVFPDRYAAYAARLIALEEARAADIEAGPAMLAGMLPSSAAPAGAKASGIPVMPFATYALLVLLAFGAVLLPRARRND